MGRITVISGAERRRRWSDEDRARILAAISEPGAVVAEVARREDVCASLVFKLRREMRQAVEAKAGGFAPVVIEAAPSRHVRAVNYNPGRPPPGRGPTRHKKSFRTHLTSSPN